jgi:hypothetical protein
MTYCYEWTWEVTDEHGDIIAHGFWDTLAECRKDALPDADIALMWRDGNDDDGELERAYAYMEGGALPALFDNGWHKVPQRFHREVRRGCANG